jgi:hypothetical protein
VLVAGTTKSVVRVEDGRKAAASRRTPKRTAPWLNRGAAVKIELILNES